MPTFERVDQICVLVENLDEAIATYSPLFAAKSWRGYRYGPDTVAELEYRGAPGTFSMWLALSDTTPQIELIQSVEGPSLYTEWIERFGFGFHHIGMVSANLAADTQGLEAQGFVVSQSGRGYGLDGDGGFAYFDSFERLGLVLELIEVPRRRRTPDREWASG
jgi:methylmalonyl-CoA/ethylmalonyl-CoA epimerase